MPTGAEQFVVDLKKAGEGMVESELILFHKEIGIRALQGVVFRTPRDTGRAQGNWQLDINAIPEGVVERFTGDEAVREGKRKLEEIKAFAVVYITNNVEYIVYLEEGSSNQAPHGMIQVTLEELRQEL